MSLIVLIRLKIEQVVDDKVATGILRTVERLINESRRMNRNRKLRIDYAFQYTDLSF